MTDIRVAAMITAIVLMDEPTGNLDKENTRNIMELIDELNKTQKQTFILTTHDLEIAKFAHRVSLLHDGEITDNQVV